MVKVNGAPGFRHHYGDSYYVALGVDQDRYHHKVVYKLISYSLCRVASKPKLINLNYSLILEPLNNKKLKAQT